MLVKLLTYTQYPEEIVYTAAKTCYSPAGPGNIWDVAIRKDFTASVMETFLAKLLDAGHMSPFEHASFTFAVENVSRVTTHQLVRHRLASYSQQSQRYVQEKFAGDMGDEWKLVIPPSVPREVRGQFMSHEENCIELYENLIKSGVSKEDARYVLPSGWMTSIVVTMNARELIHFHDLRATEAAQWEIRELAEIMLDLAAGAAPALFKHKK